MGEKKGQVLLNVLGSEATHVTCTEELVLWCHLGAGDWERLPLAVHPLPGNNATLWGREHEPWGERRPLGYMIGPS